MLTAIFASASVVIAIIAWALAGASGDLLSSNPRLSRYAGKMGLGALALSLVLAFLAGRFA